MIIACALLALLTVPRTTLANGNDFISVDLRVDRPEIAYAGAYQVMLYATAAARPAVNDFTNSYLSVWLDNLTGTYGKSFTQVGLINRSNGFRWFVYAEDGFTYCRGTLKYEGRGCEGTDGDIVSEGNWYNVELRNTGTEWDAMLYDTVGFPWVLATVNKISYRIYRATVTMEEGFEGTQDPYYYILNFMYLPKILVDYQTITFQNWPRSDTGIDLNQDPWRFSILFASDLVGGSAFCPDHYGAYIDYGVDEYYWGAGTGYTTCWALMFRTRTYIPRVTSP